MVTIRMVFVQPDPTSAGEQCDRVTESFRGRFGRVAALMDEAKANVLALAFPQAHCKRIRSSKPLGHRTKRSSDGRTSGSSAMRQQ